MRGSQDVRRKDWLSGWPALILLVVTNSDSGSAAPSAAPYDCRFTEHSITIDGRLDEPAWQDAAVINRFSLPWLAPDDPPATKATRARLLWDREHLYVAADMDDGDLYANVREHDGPTWNNDVFEVFLKPAVENPGYYEFHVTPNNTQFDLFLPRRGHVERFRRGREFHITSAVAVRGTLDRWDDRDDGWTVEMRIPWSDLMPTGGRPEPGAEWRFALCRYDFDVGSEKPELSTSAPLGSLPHPDFHHFEDYAPIRFGGPDERVGGRPFGIPRYVPVTTGKVVGTPDQPPPYTVEGVYPNAIMDAAIVVAAQPGTDLLLVATEPSWGLPSQILRVKNGPAPFEPETLLGVDHPERHSGTVHYSITFHPEFATNGYVFIGSNGPRRPGDTDPRSGQPGVADRMTRITRYRIDPRPPHTFYPDTARVIIAWDSNGHDGGDTAFGPDGMLYVTSGDGTSDSDADLAGQDLAQLRAKVLRIDVDHPDADRKPEGQAYLVPPDNPFVGQPGVRPETWAYGLRNPWRITCDRHTGQIWVGNNGQDLWEQVYLLERGANYGWSLFEGSHPFAKDRRPGPHPITPPTFEHSHAEARSLTGGVVYHGDVFPELRGCYLYGDYLTGRIWAGRHDGQRVLRHELIADTTLQITSFCVSALGEILISDHQAEQKGGIFRLTRRPQASVGASTFPRRLSESGLFASVTEHAMAPGVIPYGVNSPFWSDGTHKVRFLALPPRRDEAGRVVPDPIDVTNENGWRFPDGTVLVKSFAIERDEGIPATRQWIETRFMLKEAGEWAGYSYEWNAEQTDAVLVDAAGKDHAFAIRTADLATHPDGVKTLRWRYPSRVECMVCHSRASNFVLGLCTVQLNRDFDYAAVLGTGHAPDNQLRTLEHLGMLRSNWWSDAVAAFHGQLPAGPEDETRSDKDRRVKEATARWIAPLDGNDKTIPSRRSQLLRKAPAATNRLVDPLDSTHDLASRARSYLHSNCSSCHQPSGGGNAMFSLLYRSAFREPELSQQRLIDERPMHHTFGLPEARIIAAGDPARSVLYSRISRRGPGQMPQLATNVVDEKGLAVVREWIESLAAPPRSDAVGHDTRDR